MLYIFYVHFGNTYLICSLIAVPKNQMDIPLVDPVRYIVNTGQYAPKSCTECTPLLGRRPLRKGSGNNVALLSLGVILIGGITIGSYLLAQDSKSIL